jgi:hypothetical protein
VVVEPEPEPQRPTTPAEEVTEAEEDEFEETTNIFDGPSNASSEAEVRESALEVLRSVQTESSEVSARDNEAESIEVKQHNKVALYTLANESLNTVSRATVELLLEVKVPTAREVADNPSFLDGLSQLDDDLREAESQSYARFRLAEDTVLGVSLSMTVGALAWALRGGAIFTSLMTVAPLWASIDLGKVATPVVGRKSGDNDKEPMDEQSVEQIFDKE